MNDTLVTVKAINKVNQAVVSVIVATSTAIAIPQHANELIVYEDQHVYDLLSIFSYILVVAMNISLFGGAAVVQA